MADFNEFEGSAEDPAAEFLAREQNEMAGLEDDNFGGNAAAPAGKLWWVWGSIRLRWKML